MMDYLDIFPSLMTEETERKQSRKMEIQPFEIITYLAKQQRCRLMQKRKYEIGCQMFDE